MILTKRRGSLLIVVAILVAGCETPKPVPDDTPAARPPMSDSAIAITPASADVRGYFEAKKKYGKAQALVGGWSQPTQEMNDLDARLRAIIGPVVIDGRALDTRISIGEAMYDGEDNGRQLDGQAFTHGKLQVIASTRGLLSGWLAADGIDSAGGSLGALESDIALTAVFSPGATVQRYANLRKHADLPREVFVAKLVLIAQDNGDWPPDKLIVGVARGERIYLVITTPSWVMPSPKECQPFNEQSFYECYDRVAAERPEYAQLVAQVREIAATFPDK